MKTTTNNLKDISLIKQQFKALLKGDEYLCTDPIFGYDGFIRLQITNIQVEIKEKLIIITVTLERPGLLIGKGGKDIDAISKRINEWLDKSVKIEIKESNIWR